MAQQISSQLNEAFTQSIALVESFTEKELNTVPFEGSWTPGQVADHILKSANGMDKLLLEPGKPAGRPADEKAEEFKNLFLDFSIKMKSPDFILPDERDFTVAELTERLKSTRQAIANAVPKADLEGVPSLGEQHPLDGSTKLELVHFLTYHTMRHNHQMEKMKQ